MTVGFSTASQPINITLGLPSQRGGADGDRGEEGWGVERWQKWDLRDTQTYKNRHKNAHIVRPQRCTHKYTHGQSDKYLLMGLNSSSIPRRKLLLSNKQISSINSDSPHWPVTGTKLNVNTPPASLSLCSRLSQNAPVNGAHPSSAATARDPWLSKLAFPQSQPDSKKWCRVTQREAARADLVLHLWDLCFASSHTELWTRHKEKHLQLNS